MKNQKGFTLIEILAVITILGLLVAIAIPAVNKELANFRMKYYRQLENTIKSAGQEYIGDKRFSKPTKLLYTKIIKADDMVEKNYMSEYRDYNKKECDKEENSYSYVVVVKTADKKYEYQTCLKCSNDEYYTDTSDTELDLCNPAWLTNDNITYGISNENNDGTLWVYYGTTYEEIERQVGIKYGIVKNDSSGNSITIIEDPTVNRKEIYPDNINDLVTANLDQVVTLRYSLPDGEVITRNARFYRYEAPVITMTYGVKNEYSNKNVGASYNQGTDEWANTITVNAAYNNTDKSKYAEVISEYGIDYLEYYVNGEWRQATSCSAPGGSECTWAFSDNYNGNIKFRLVDKKGNKSKETTFYSVKVDKTEPEVALSVTGTKESGVFVSDAVLHLTKSDNSSGIVKYGIDTSLNYNGKDSLTITDDSSNTYYGYVMDKAGNQKVSEGILVVVDKEYIITLNGNGANNPAGSTSATATYGEKTLSSITNPGKRVTVSFYQNGTGATIGGVATSWDTKLTGDYIFTGWYTATSDGTKVASTDTTPALEASTAYTDSSKKWNKVVSDNSVNLYALWDRATVNLPTVTKTGNTCKWNNQADGAGTLTYVSGGTYRPTSATTREFYAICTPNTYTITYDYNGGTAPSSGVPSSYTYGTGATINGTPMRVGYEFTGWTGSNGETAQKTLTISTSDYGNKTYKANWKARNVTITYDVNTDFPTQWKYIYNNRYITSNNTKTSNFNAPGTVSGAVVILDGYNTSNNRGLTMPGGSRTPTYSSSIKGYIFDGNDYIKAGKYSGSKNLTLEVVFGVDTHYSNGTLISYAEGGGFNFWISRGAQDPEGGFKYTIKTCVGQRPYSPSVDVYDCISTAQTLVAGKKYYAAVTYNYGVNQSTEKNLKLFFNGVKKNSRTTTNGTAITSPTASSVTTMIGAEPGATSGPFDPILKGRIYTARIYKKTLSETKIRENYMRENLKHNIEDNQYERYYLPIRTIPGRKYTVHYTYGVRDGTEINPTGSYSGLVLRATSTEPGNTRITSDLAHGVIKYTDGTAKDDSFSFTATSDTSYIFPDFGTVEKDNENFKIYFGNVSISTSVPYNGNVLDYAPTPTKRSGTFKGWTLDGSSTLIDSNTLCPYDATTYVGKW